MAEYTKGGQTFEATQYNGATNEAAIIALGTTGTRHGIGNIQKVGHETLMVTTATGEKYAKRGDWILQETTTEALEVEKVDIFPSGYELVEVEP